MLRWQDFQKHKFGYAALTEIIIFNVKYLELMKAVTKKPTNWSFSPNFKQYLMLIQIIKEAFKNFITTFKTITKLNNHESFTLPNYYNIGNHAV